MHLIEFNGNKIKTSLGVFPSRISMPCYPCGFGGFWEAAIAAKVQTTTTTAVAAKMRRDGRQNDGLRNRIKSN